MQKSKLQFKIKNLKFLAVVFSFSLCAFSFAIPVSAIELYFEPRSQEFGLEHEFQVSLIIDPQGKEINAVEASIVFPKDLVEIKSIEDGSSILTLWVEKPSVLHEADTKIRFAGVIPGGFKGIMAPFEEIYPGKLLSLTLTAIKEGAGEFRLEDVQVLLHDGKGTKAEFQVSGFRFQVSEDIEIIPVERVLDIIPPEPFTPEIARDPNIFDGKWFLVFATQDKDSGIAYYVIHETRQKKEAARINPKDWTESESPYLLKDQELRSYIFVKAVDKAGNERIAIVEPEYPIKWYEIWWIWAIIIIVGVISVIVLWVRKRRKVINSSF